MMPSAWPRAPWSSVVPGDRVLAADGQVWECTGRDGMRLTLQLPATCRAVTRRAPAGDVPVLRGEEGREMVAAARVLAGAGFAVEVIDSRPLTTWG